MKALKKGFGKAASLTAKQTKKFTKSIGKELGKAGKDVGSSIASAPGTIKKDTGRALKQLDVRQSKAIKVMSQLLGKPWEEQKWYVKLVIVFTLICIFPAIPMFYVMGIMLRAINTMFFYTRKL